MNSSNIMIDLQIDDILDDVTMNVSFVELNNSSQDKIV